MIVISSALVMSRGLTFDEHLPIICYDNQVTTANVTSDEADPNFPVTNLANPQTISWWKAIDTNTQYVTVSLPGDELTDYIAVARHNFGSSLASVSVEGITADIGAVWTQLVAPQQFPDDAPAIFLFPEIGIVGIRLKIVSATIIPQIAVLYTGHSLKVQKGIQTGHTPITMSKQSNVTNGTSINGNFLGNIITSEKLSNNAQFKDMDATWYRTYMQPFIDVSRTPFFFAWAPIDYPEEVGYCWASSDPVPSISQRTGQIDLTLPMQAVSL